MRTTPQQYFEGQQYVPPNNTLNFIIISIVAGVALGLAIGVLVKNEK